MSKETVVKSTAQTPCFEGLYQDAYLATAHYRYPYVAPFINHFTIYFKLIQKPLINVYFPSVVTGAG